MTTPVVASQRIRFKFVLRFDHTDRKEKPKKNLWKNTVGPNEFTDFEKFEVERRQGTKSICGLTSAQRARIGITPQLTALRGM